MSFRGSAESNKAATKSYFFLKKKYNYGNTKLIIKVLVQICFVITNFLRLGHVDLDGLC